jgi:hypothetical protein
MAHIVAHHEQGCRSNNCCCQYTGLPAGLVARVGPSPLRHAQTPWAWSHGHTYCVCMYLHADRQHPTTVQSACWPVAAGPPAHTRLLQRCGMHMHAAVMHAVRMQLTRCLGQPRPPSLLQRLLPSNKPWVPTTPVSAMQEGYVSW